MSITQETRDKIAEWIKDPEMELTWGAREKWYTLSEFIEYGASLDSRLEDGDNFETRKRQSNVDKFIEEFIASLFRGEEAIPYTIENLKNVMKKFNIGELPK